jgi:hypothetical protein
MEEESESENIDDLFERCKVSGTFQEKEELAEAYLDIFNEMCYDFACSKLTEEGILELYPIVEKIEFLKDSSEWSLRAQTYHILMEDSEMREDNISVVRNGQLAIGALSKQLAEGAEEKYITYQSLSYCYYTLINYLPEEATLYWGKALQYIKEAILGNSREANWIQYFTVLYSSLKQESSVLKERREQERTAFRNWSLALEEKEGALSFFIASQFIRFKEFSGDSESEGFIFPEKEYFFWLEKSLEDDLLDLSPMKISDAGHYYKKEGVRLQRIDLLERALAYFEKIFYTSSNDELFCIYYISDVLENIALIYTKQGLSEKADSYLTNALQWNEDKQELIQGNFSLLIHYAEFLERCYHYKGNIPKPTLELIKSVVKKAESTGGGYYSGPYFLEARLALEQKNEHLVVACLCKNLLLHELCIENQVEEFYNYLTKGTYSYLEKFLENTLLFMKEVSEGYYFNPKITFAELNSMSEMEVIETWIIRKAEIKKRKTIL